MDGRAKGVEVKQRECVRTREAYYSRNTAGASILEGPSEEDLELSPKPPPQGLQDTRRQTSTDLLYLTQHQAEIKREGHSRHRYLKGGR